MKPKLEANKRQRPTGVAVQRVVRRSGRKCKCDLCQKWSPLHRRIMAKLRGKDRKLFDEYLMMNASDSDDLGAANAKLAGDWPGWEWMKTDHHISNETLQEVHTLAGLVYGSRQSLSTEMIIQAKKVAELMNNARMITPPNAPAEPSRN